MIGEPESETKKEQERTPPPPAIIRVFRALKRYEIRRRSRRKKEAGETEITMARWTRRVGQFTLFLAVVGLLTAVIFWRQLNVMQGQLDVMAADQRPWVSFEDFGIAGSLSFDDIGSTGGKRWHVKVRYQLKNYGKTPAAHVAGWAHILPIVSHHQIEGKWHGTFVGDATLGACSWTEL